MMPLRLARLVPAFMTPSHVGALVTLAAVSAWLSGVVRRERRRGDGPWWRRICWTIAVGIVGGSLFQHGWDLTTGAWTPQTGLPLHLCDIGVYVTAATLVLAARRPRLDAVPALIQRLYDLAYFWGLGGTLQAVLTPDITAPFPHIVWFRYFVTHGGILVGVLVMTIGLGFRPHASGLARVWLTTLTLAVPVLGIDLALGANYMYLCGPPENPTIIDWFGPWPWSLLTLVVVGTLLIALWYGPFWVMDRLRPRREM
jgi:hypothetical integral membrane protein (TIGR02206 family)